MPPSSRPDPSRRARAAFVVLALLGAVLGGSPLVSVAVAHAPSSPSSPDAYVPRAGPNLTSWNLANVGQAPPATAGGALAYDAADGYVVLFGGCTSGNYWYSTCLPTNATWIFSNNTWTRLATSVSPPARYEASLTWDAVDGYDLLFGGNSSSGFLNDTWSFVHGNWTPLSPTHVPAARARAALAFDAADNGTVLFGGEQYRQLVNASTETYVGADFNDTWVWSGGDWQAIATPVAPVPRDGASVSTDPASGGIVLFGGFNWSIYNLGDTWTFAHQQWTNVSPAVSPMARNYGAFAYDPLLNASVLVGGHNGYAYDPNTYAYANGSWTFLNQSSNGGYGNGSSSGGGPGPTAQWGANAVYDAAGGCFLLFGGYAYTSSSLQGNYSDQTWTLGSACNFTAPGSGGSGSGGGNGNGGGGGAAPSPLAASGELLAAVGTSSVTATFRVTIHGGVAPYTIQWRFGDGSFGSGVNGESTVHTYSSTGSFVPEVTVTDGLGHVSTQTLAPIRVAAAGSPHPVSIPSAPLIDLAAAAVIGAIAIAVLGVRWRHSAWRHLAAEGEELVRRIESEREN